MTSSSLPFPDFRWKNSEVPEDKERENRLEKLRKTHRFAVQHNAELALDLYTCGAPSLVVLHHGIFGYRRMHELEDLAEHLLGHFDVLVLDCRGHGDSTGRFSFGRREWEDLEQVARKFGEDYQAVGGVGFSFGGFHTSLAAAQTDCFDAVWIVSAPKDFWILDHNPFGPGLSKSLQLMRKRARRRTRLHWLEALGPRIMPIDCVERIQIPVHFIHGDQDWLIHHQHSEKMFEKAPDPKRLDVLPGGVHAEYLIRQMPKVFLGLLTESLKERLPFRQRELSGY